MKFIIATNMASKQASGVDNVFALMPEKDENDTDALPSHTDDHRSMPPLKNPGIAKAMRNQEPPPPDPTQAQINRAKKHTSVAPDKKASNLPDDDDDEIEREEEENRKALGRFQSVEPPPVQEKKCVDFVPDDHAKKKSGIKTPLELMDEYKTVLSSLLCAIEASHREAHPELKSLSQAIIMAINTFYAVYLSNNSDTPDARVAMEFMSVTLIHVHKNIEAFVKLNRDEKQAKARNPNYDHLIADDDAYDRATRNHSRSRPRVMKEDNSRSPNSQPPQPSPTSASAANHLPGINAEANGPPRALVIQKKQSDSENSITSCRKTALEEKNEMGQQDKTHTNSNTAKHSIVDHPYAYASGGEKVDTFNLNRTYGNIENVQATNNECSIS